MSRCSVGTVTIGLETPQRSFRSKLASSRSPAESGSCNVASIGRPSFSIWEEDAVGPCLGVDSQSTPSLVDGVKKCDESPGFILPREREDGDIVDEESMVVRGQSDVISRSK